MQAIEMKLPNIWSPHCPGLRRSCWWSRITRFSRRPTRATIRWWRRRGSGAMIEDVDGNTFLDFAAGIAVCSTGHCHPDVVRAIQKQAAQLIHMSGTDFYYPNLVELAERWPR
jgi:4-aminobutyrate aminotransferase-like enzyme